VARAAVEQSGLALQHVVSDLKGDRAVVLAAVTQQGLALQHASAELRKDREVVQAAVGQSAQALQHADAELRADRDIVLDTAKRDGGALRYAAPALCADREVLAALHQDPRSIVYASEALQEDPDIRAFVLEQAAKVPERKRLKPVPMDAVTNREPDEEVPNTRLLDRFRSAGAWLRSRAVRDDAIRRIESEQDQYDTVVE